MGGDQGLCYDVSKPSRLTRKVPGIGESEDCVEVITAEKIKKSARKPGAEIKGSSEKGGPPTNLELRLLRRTQGLTIQLWPKRFQYRTNGTVAFSIPPKPQQPSDEDLYQTSDSFIVPCGVSLDTNKPKRTKKTQLLGREVSWSSEFIQR